MNTHLNTFKAFFKELAIYFRRENDLSDVTVALCNANMEFKQIFLKYFFKELTDEQITDALIKREVPDDTQKNSRVDILVDFSNGDRYLIEVKIYDQNHHFGQYEKAYRVPSDRLGYIANYTIDKEGYDVKTWEDFYHILEKNSFNILIEGYKEYLKSVCGIDKFIDEKIDIKSDDYAQIFSDIAQKIIVRNKISELDIRYHKKYPNKLGFGFDFGIKGELPDAYAIFHVETGENPQVAIIIHARDWLENAVMMNADEFIAGSSLIDKPYKKNVFAPTNVYIPLNYGKVQDLIASSDFKIHKDILQMFFNDVILRISTFIK